MPFNNLVKGFRQFQAEYFRRNIRLYKKLVTSGQAPDTLVIACSDSRNDPALLTRSKPGDIFVVRNVAAIVPPYGPDGKYHGTSAAIEFAVKGLGVRDIMVLGHALCGGVRALAERDSGTDPYEFLSHWIEIGAPARDAVERELASAAPEVRLRALEQAMIVTSLSNLMTFPWIRDKVAAGTLTLHGWYFDMLAGQMLGYDFQKGCFTEVPRRGDDHGGANGNAACGCDFSVQSLLRDYA